MQYFQRYKYVCIENYHCVYSLLHERTNNWILRYTMKTRIRIKTFVLVELPANFICAIIQFGNEERPAAKFLVSFRIVFSMK